MDHGKILQHVLKGISVTQFLDYKEYLEKIFSAMKQELGAYSYMQYSEDLGFTRSNIMYLLVKGTRPLTKKTGQKIAKGLALTGVERRYWEDLVAYFASDQAVEKESIFEHLVKQKSKSVSDSERLLSQLEFFAEWYHVAIFEMSLTPDFPEDPAEIASRLIPKIRVDQAKKSLLLLQRLKLLALDPETGQWQATQESIQTGHEISSLAITRYHQKILELAKQSLMTIATEEREILTSTVALSETSLQKIKAEIRASHERILAISQEDKERDRVYQVSFQCFPMTKAKKKGKI